MHFHETGLNKEIVNLVVDVNGPKWREPSEWFNVCAPKMIKSLYCAKTPLNILFYFNSCRRSSFLHAKMKRQDIFHSVVLCVMQWRSLEFVHCLTCHALLRWRDRASWSVWFRLYSVTISWATSRRRCVNVRSVRRWGTVLCVLYWTQLIAIISSTAQNKCI